MGFLPPSEGEEAEYGQHPDADGAVEHHVRKAAGIQPALVSSCMMKKQRPITNSPAGMTSYDDVAIVRETPRTTSFYSHSIVPGGFDVTS